MNIAKFIATVLGTALYVSAFWITIFVSHREPITGLAIVILFLGGIGIFAGFLNFLAEHWDE